MFAHDFGNLKDCNAVLSVYGPDSMKKRERIVVNTKPGQESAIERHNIQLVSPVILIIEKRINGLDGWFCCFQLVIL